MVLVSLAACAARPTFALSPVPRGAAPRGSAAPEGLVS